LTISSILQKPNSYVTECTHTLACAVMKGLNSARAHLECVHSLHDSVDYNALRVAKFKKWGRKCVYLRLKSHKECRFFFKLSMITNVILILYNSSINNKLILRDLRFRHHIACFCCISPRQNNSTATALFCLSKHDSDSLNESMNRYFKWFGSVSVIRSWMNQWTVTLNDSVRSQWFVPEWINEPFKWFGSVAMTHLLTVTCCHLLAI